MKLSFNKIYNKMLNEATPPTGGNNAANMPGGDMGGGMDLGGGMGATPGGMGGMGAGGMGAAPGGLGGGGLGGMGGGMDLGGGLGGMGGGMGGGAPVPPKEIEIMNAWDALEKILDRLEGKNNIEKKEK